MLEPEQWRPVPGWPMYEVSSLGRVASYYGANRTRRLLRCTPSRTTGYPVVDLRGAGRRRLVTVHAVVAEAFIGPRPDGMEVRHLDGDCLNATLSNLAYGTHAENEQDKWRHGTARGQVSECVNGHNFDDENTHVDPRNGRRYCRLCTRVNSRRYRARKKQQLAQQAPQQSERAA